MSTRLLPHCFSLFLWSFFTSSFEIVLYSFLKRLASLFLESLYSWYSFCIVLYCTCLASIGLLHRFESPCILILLLALSSGFELWRRFIITWWLSIFLIRPSCRLSILCRDHSALSHFYFDTGTSWTSLQCSIQILELCRPSEFLRLSQKLATCQNWRSSLRCSSERQHEAPDLPQCLSLQTIQHKETRPSLFQSRHQIRSNTSLCQCH